MEDDIKQQRLNKRKSLKDLGNNPYPVFVKRTHTTKEALDGFSELTKKEELLKLTGRMVTFRAHGGVSFANIKDGKGSLQIAFKKDSLGAHRYDDLEKYLDIGDFLEVEGVLFETKRGEKTLEVRDFEVISKNIRPLPEKWHGLKDVEQRYRRRYLDILMNEEVRRIAETRSKITEETREFLKNEDFLEVETPILQSIPGGASAQPFKTHLKAHNMDMYLRIAPELYLKRLLVAGFDKVYELGRNFRNEGVDYSHNPEFTMLEFYSAYSDYKEGMKLTERLLLHLIKNTVGDVDTYEYEKSKVDLKTPWERVEFKDLLHRYAKVDYENYNFEGLKKKAEELGVKIGKDVQSKAHVADNIYKKYCQPKLVNPTFVIHHPAEMLPLAKPLPDNPQYAASFQLVVAGWEMVKGYSELNDPVVQREFFEEQEKLRKKGDSEAQFMDEDFIEALEYGMPPALGFGMGIDRLAAFLSGSHSLREVILFPTMKPKDK